VPEGDAPGEHRGLVDESLGALARRGLGDDAQQGFVPDART
jgi:hypothetical protein